MLHMPRVWLLLLLASCMDAVRMTLLRPVLELALEVPLPPERLDCAPEISI